MVGEESYTPPILHQKEGIERRRFLMERQKGKGGTGTRSTQPARHVWEKSFPRRCQPSDIAMLCYSALLNIVRYCIGDFVFRGSDEKMTISPTVVETADRTVLEIYDQQKVMHKVYEVISILISIMY